MPAQIAIANTASYKLNDDQDTFTLILDNQLRHEPTATADYGEIAMVVIDGAVYAGSVIEADIPTSANAAINGNDVEEGATTTEGNEDTVGLIFLPVSCYADNTLTVIDIDMPEDV